MSMSGMYGPYSMTREASGTSWQPEAASHAGIHLPADDWMVMLHGYAWANWTDQGGPRGGDDAFVASMAMVTAERRRRSKLP